VKRAKLYGAISVAIGLASGTAIALMLLVGLARGSGSENDASSSAAGTTNSSADSAGSGLQEGIQVHGDWVIEVRNPDGSLADRREFENALTGSGSEYLDRILWRDATVGEWAVAALHPSAPCPLGGCAMTEVGGTKNWGFDPQQTFATLVRSTQVNPNQFILTGNFDAVQNGSIAEVHTLLCISTPPNLNAGACNNYSTFTATTLQAPVNVDAGQQVLVTVRISFS
jgi:hypothetical protein